MAILWELYGKGLNEAAGAVEKTLQNRRTASALGGLDLSTTEGALQASKALIGMGRTAEGMTLAQLAMQERNRQQEFGLKRDDLALRRAQEERTGGYQQQTLGLQRDQLAATTENQRAQRNLQEKQLLRREIPAGFEFAPDGSMRPIAGGPADPAYKAATEKTKDPFEKANVDRVSEMRTAGDKSRETLSDIAQLEEARRKAFTGGVMRVPGLSNIVTGVTPANQTLEGLTNRLSIAFSGDMKGALSDKDITFIGKAQPGAAMSDEAAAPIIAAMKAGALRVRERSKFYETWLSRNKTLEGSDDAWDKFINEKPIVTSGSNGQPQVNQANISAWKEYVATNPAPARGGTPQRGAPAPAQTAAPAQARVIGPAPQGATEGRTGTLPDGRKVIVRGGQIELAQ